MNPTRNRISRFFLSSLLFIVGVLLFIVVSLTKFLFILYEIFIPRGLREIVPHTIVWRKYLLYATNIFSPPQRMEILEVEEEVEELRIKEEKINKAYPIQRGVGEAYDHALIFLLIIVLSIVTIGSASTDFESFFENMLTTLKISDLQWYWYVIIIFAFSTMMGILSTITTIFGPVYAIFHRSSLRMVKMGAYSWATIYQKLSDLFALPYIASKASFTYFDAPPISKETFEEFKGNILGDIDVMRLRVANLIKTSSSSIPVRTRELFTQITDTTSEERLDMNKIADSTSRAFSLLIWQSETSPIPWKKEPGLFRFAEKKNFSYKEAKETFAFITVKLKERFVSENFYKSILLTGALKGVSNTELKYNFQLSDVEYNQLAFALAIGAQRFIIDHYSIYKFKQKTRYFIGNFLFGFIVPLIELVDIIVSYGQYIVNRLRFYFAKGWIKHFFKFFSIRFKEIQNGLCLKVFEESKEEEKADANSEEVKKKSINIIKSFLIFFLQVLLALPLSLFFTAKSLLQALKEVLRKRIPEKKKKKSFEKEIGKESLVTMYEEIYNKLVLDTFYCT